MITKEQFIKVISLSQDYEKEVDKWCDFGITIYDMPISEIHGQLFDIFLENLFTVDGVDWINWWLYERISPISPEPLKAYNEDGSIIPTETVEDLWELVKDYRK
ncbi:MAG: hypothetical protein ACI4OP_03965 [Candidatus Coprovivens sp.]